MGNKPDGRPEPVPDGHLCNDLDLSILKRLLSSRRQSCRANRIYDISSGLVASDGARVKRIVRSTFAGRGEIEDIIVKKLVQRNIG